VHRLATSELRLSNYQWNAIEGDRVGNIGRLADLSVVLATAGSIAVTCLSIYFLRKENSTKIYLIWYLFSLSLFIAFSVFAYANLAGVMSIEDMFGRKLSRIIFSIYAYSLDFGEELKLIAFVVLLVCVPQLLAYVLSGISGSSSSLVFVSRISQVAIWSMIKFLAVCSGLFLASPLSDILTGELNTNYLYIVNSLINIASAFGLMAGYLRGLPLLSRAVEVESFRFISRIHAYCTRNKVDVDMGPH
jgi:hypothetical protein